MYDPGRGQLRGNGLGLAGMIVGIVAVVLVCANLIAAIIAVVGMGLSIAGLYLAAKHKDRKKGAAIAGLILSIIAFIGGIAVFATGQWIGAKVQEDPEFLQKWAEEQNRQSSRSPGNMPSGESSRNSRRPRRRPVRVPQRIRNPELQANSFMPSGLEFGKASIRLTRPSLTKLQYRQAGKVHTSDSYAIRFRFLVTGSGDVYTGLGRTFNSKAEPMRLIDRQTLYVRVRGQFTENPWQDHRTRHRLV